MVFTLQLNHQLLTGSYRVYRDHYWCERYHSG